MFRVWLLLTELTLISGIIFAHCLQCTAARILMLPTTRVFVSASYVRNMHNGKTCVEAGYEDITSRSQCESAFRSHPEHPEKESLSSHVSWCHCTVHTPLLWRSHVDNSFSPIHRCNCPVLFCFRCCWFVLCCHVRRVYHLPVYGAAAWADVLATTLVIFVGIGEARMSRAKRTYPRIHTYSVCSLRLRQLLKVRP